MALHGNSATTIGQCFRALGNAYQIGNDILNFSGGDGANTAVRHAPPRAKWRGGPVSRDAG